MVFSKEKWNNADELNKFIPVSAALSFESVQSSLKDAWRLFVLPLLGGPLTEKVEAYYEDDAPTALQLKVLEECQCAVANLAFWYNYQELNVRISDQGMHRQESDGSFKQTFKYQEDQLRASFKNKGFNALDRLIEIFDKNKKDFPLYEQSPAYASRKSAIVRSTAEVDANYFINKSHLIFLRLKPIFKFVEETVLPSVLGYELNKALMVAIKDGEDKIGDTTTEEFRLRCASFVVLKSIAQLIRQTGSLTVLPPAAAMQSANVAPIGAKRDIGVCTSPVTVRNFPVTGTFWTAFAMLKAVSTFRTTAPTWIGRPPGGMTRPRVS